MKFLLQKSTLAFFLAAAGLLTLLLSANTGNKQVLDSAGQYYGRQLDSISACIRELERAAATADAVQLKQLFEQSRYHFKKAEALIEYHFPASAQRLNGAALLESEASEPNEPQHPRGFQVLEEIVYGGLDENTRRDIRYEASNILNTLDRLKTLQPELELSEGNLLDAIRLNIYRMIIKGITGFDSPVALRSLPEARATLEGSRDLLSLFPGSATVRSAAEQAISYLRQHGEDFNSFDRAVFITRYVNPLCIRLYEFREQQRIPLVQQSQALNGKARHLFEQHAFEVLYFAPDGTSPATPAEVALGRRLFSETALSGNSARSCASCHQPGKAFTDGKKVNESLLGGQTLMRNTPTLLNAALQPVQFYDGRIAFLEDQAHDVIRNDAEMGGEIEATARRLGQDKSYSRMFYAAYKTRTPGGEQIKKALAAYIRSLSSMNSPFDRYMRGAQAAMTAEQVKGFNLFAGKAKCATCHFIPLFSGAVPPLYHKTESEVLGVPAGTDTLHAIMDTDSGKYLLYGIPHQLYSFKTVSVRNAAVTAPYMHNGVYRTLEEVIDFYDRGGGAGLGFDLPNQTLPGDRLQLQPGEKKALVAFLQALTDTASIR